MTVSVGDPTISPSILAVTPLKLKAILSRVTNPGYEYQGRHYHPPDGQPQEPYDAPVSMPADQPQHGQPATPVPPVAGRPASGPPRGYPRSANYLSAPLGRARKKVGKTQLIVGMVTAFVLVVCAAVALAVVSGDSGKSGQPAAAPTELATSASSTPSTTPPPDSTTTPTAPAPATSQNKPAPQRTRKPPATHSSQRVHPGALCSPAGAWGVTANGKAVRCGPSETDARNRWRVV
jgi:hypothetical protein